VVALGGSRYTNRDLRVFVHNTEVLGRSSPLFRQLEPNRFVGEEKVVGREVDDVGHIIVVWVSEGAGDVKKLCGSPWWVMEGMQVVG